MIACLNSALLCSKCNRGKILFKINSHKILEGLRVVVLFVNEKFVSMGTKHLFSSLILNHNLRVSTERMLLLVL